MRIQAPSIAEYIILSELEIFLIVHIEFSSKRNQYLVSIWLLAQFQNFNFPVKYSYG